MIAVGSRSWPARRQRERDRHGGIHVAPLDAHRRTPGIGIELAPDAQERHPYRPRQVQTRLHVDGSVVDQ